MADVIGGTPGGIIGEPFNLPLTAHFIGGCAIGDSAETGVIDPYQRVYGHPGLHVVDGSAITANLGVNPSLTITAQAERAMAFWPNKGEADAGPPPGAVPAVEPVPPQHPVVPDEAAGGAAAADRVGVLTRAPRTHRGGSRRGGPAPADPPTSGAERPATAPFAASGPDRGGRDGRALRVHAAAWTEDPAWEGSGSVLPNERRGDGLRLATSFFHRVGSPFSYSRGIRWFASSRPSGSSAERVPLSRCQTSAGNERRTSTGDSAKFR